MTTLPELARELEMPDHVVWLAAAPLLRIAGWESVFERGLELTRPAEFAVRDSISGLRRALGGE